MEHFVTILDSRFLPQGLALNASLKNVCPAYRLWVMCVDAEAKRTLDVIGDRQIVAVDVQSMETDALRSARSERNRGEYCWTLTPFAPSMVFQLDPSVDRITYVDADMFLLKSPEQLFAEFEASGKSVLITDHFYDPRYDQSSASGRYCVQFMTFLRDRSDHVLRWWQERCIEWCYARFEDGKFGDQKYLDDWPERFPEFVHVLAQPSALQAPWNARRFADAEPVAYHFHGLRLIDRHAVVLFRDYDIPPATVTDVYGAYVKALGDAVAHLPVVYSQTVQMGPIWRIARRALYQVRRLTWGKQSHFKIARIPTASA